MELAPGRGLDPRLGQRLFILSFTFMVNIMLSHPLLYAWYSISCVHTTPRIDYTPRPTVLVLLYAERFAP